jgi:hypothetical protein
MFKQMGKTRPPYRITAAAHLNIERRGRFVRTRIGYQQHPQTILELMVEIIPIIGWTRDDIRGNRSNEKQNQHQKGPESRRLS